MRSLDSGAQIDGSFHNRARLVAGSNETDFQLIARRSSPPRAARLTDARIGGGY